MRHAVYEFVFSENPVWHGFECTFAAVLVHLSIN